MKLDQIHEEWSKDCIIDDTELARESSRIPILHSKYLRYLSNERMTLKTLDGEYAELRQDKSDRLTGVMSKEELDIRGWLPERRRYLKGEIEQALESDRDVIEMNLRMALQKEKADVLDSIVRSIMNRNFIVGNMINWKKFTAGVS
jgi:Recombination, repair and ssDNA binding protein UvsY